MFWEYRGIFFTFSKIKHRAIIATSVELMQSVPSTEMKVLTDSPSDELINSEVMMPAGTEVSDKSHKLCHRFSLSNPTPSSYFRYRT